MKLVCNDKDGVYYWCDSDDEGVCLSPHFDYEDDAVAWRDRIIELLESPKQD